MKRYVMQDGGDFYVFNTDPGEALDAEPDDIHNYPWHVGDFNLTDVKLARAWFLEGVSSQDEIIFI